ncbi:MAG: LD-carboxypeptidase [Bacteroidia bacterium]|nr:LD-carboxypeptidase [Bacteroidia bacterium]
MTLLPQFLHKGDKIAIVAPARKISYNEILEFVNFTKQKGLEVVFTENLFASQNQFAGTDDQRADDFQYWLDNSEIKAIIAARGGYGTARIIDKLNFEKFKKNPKWLIGFSDFTVVHCHLNSNYNIASIHAAMPIVLSKSNKAKISSFDYLFKLLEGKIPKYKLKNHKKNINGNCQGELSGGNLSVIISIMGSKSEINTDGKILFIEDLDEYLYHIDRMMTCLKRAGKLDNLKGLLVGGMNKMHNNKVRFGLSAYEIIKSHTENLNIPIYFGIDAGHISANYPLIMGANVIIEDNYLKFDH